MLDAIGASSVADLFSSIPSGLRLRARMDLPAGLCERDVVADLAALAGANALPVSFQGAGCYRDYVPAVVQRKYFLVVAAPELPLSVESTTRSFSA